MIPNALKSDSQIAIQSPKQQFSPLKSLVSKPMSPKDDPDHPPLLELDTTINSSEKHLEQLQYYEDDDLISINEQNDQKCQSYRIRFYSDDTSSLPILQILSRFEKDYNFKESKKE